MTIDSAAYSAGIRNNVAAELGAVYRVFIEHASQETIMESDRVATEENADTVVSDWLADQLSLNESVVCGMGTVDTGVATARTQTVPVTPLRLPIRVETGTVRASGQPGYRCLNLQASHRLQSARVPQIPIADESSGSAGVSIAWIAQSRVTSRADRFSRISRRYATSLRQA